VLELRSHHDGGQGHLRRNGLGVLELCEVGLIGERKESMSEPNNPPTLLAEALAGILKPIVEGAVKEAMNGHREIQLLTPEELAERLKVPLSWVYEQSRQGNIPTHRIGRYIRFNLSEVLQSQKKIE